MTTDEHHRWARLLTRALQLALVALVAYAGVVGRVGLLLNGVLALAVTFLPAGLAWRYDHAVDPRLTLWITVGAVVHAAGFLGPYDRTTGLWGWYDQVAHAVSGGFIAGVGYALVEALDRGTDRVRFPGEFRFVFTVLFILAVGVLWEIGEFAGGTLGAVLADQELLVQYGIEDIVSDLVFNTLAAVAVALWGTGYFDDIAAVVSRQISGTGRS